MNVHEVLSWASLFLEKHACEPSAAMLLLEHHLQWDRSKIYMHMQDKVSRATVDALEKDLHAHVDTGVPIQHLIGSTEFYGRDFMVSRDVLIPRFETEELVEEAIRLLRAHGLSTTGTVVDLGTGSSVIATSIACAFPQMNVYATDISESALRVAEKNIQAHHASVTCMQGNFAAPLMEQGIQVDMLISNPPYIAHEERTSLARTVRDFDPTLALFADNEGLAAYEIIMKQAVHVLKPGGIILFEIGATQALAVKEIITHTYPQSTVDILRDINGKDRIVRACV